MLIQNNYDFHDRCQMALLLDRPKEKRANIFTPSFVGSVQSKSNLHTIILKKSLKSRTNLAKYILIFIIKLG